MVSYQLGSIVDREEIRDLVVLTLQPEEMFAWEPGQFIVTQNDINGNVETADYTIVSSPRHPENFQIVVEVYAESVVGAWLKNLRPGDKIRFKGPKGRMTLQRKDRPIVIVYREIGVVVALAFLRQLVEEAFSKEVTTIGFNGSGFPDLIARYRGEFENLALETKIIELDEGIDEGKFPRKQLSQIFAPYKDRVFYIAGMSEFVRNLRTRLISWGVEKGNIYRELFGWKRNHPRRKGG